MKRILITGCRGGIGLDTAHRLLERGHTVYATVHQEKSVQGLKGALGTYGDRAIVEKLDILDAADRHKVHSWDIDVLINNAAIGDAGPMELIPVEDFQRVMDTNVFATLQLTQEILVQMRRRQEGRIIFISSLSGMIATPYLAPYSASKFALESIASSMRYELKPVGIDTVLINPGAYRTGFNQKNFEKKSRWLQQDLLSAKEREKIIKTEQMIYRLESGDIGSIAKKVVKAVEAKRPKKRYTAPWWQAVGAFVMKMLG